MGGKLFDGLYEHVVTGALARDLKDLAPGQTAEAVDLDPADAHASLARHLVSEVERLLQAVPHADRPQAQISIVNRLLEQMRD